MTTEANKKLEQLISKIAKDRCRESFVSLFELSSSKLKAYAIKCGANNSDAEEIVQEALLNVWHKAHTFNPETASVNTWLFTIVRNKRIDFVRKSRPDVILSDDLWPDASESLQTRDEDKLLSDQHESDLNAKILRTLINELPEEQRQIVFKVYFEGKSHSEIAGELDLPLGTIKSRLRLAMKKLDTLVKQNISWLIIIHLMNF